MKKHKMMYVFPQKIGICGDFYHEKIFLIIYGTALFMLTMAFLLTSNYKDYRFYITLIILLAIGKIVEGRINK